MNHKEGIEDAIKLSLLDVKDTNNLFSDIENILKYVDVLKEVSIDADDKSIELSTNTMREDKVVESDGSFREHFLKFAPEIEGDYIKVKKIII